MEFLSTPDLSRWPSSAPSARPTPISASRFQSTPFPTSAHPTPAPTRSAPFASPVDKADIKNSFRSLFSPSAPTPAFFHHHASAPNLTPFLGPMPTPNLVPHSSSLVNFPPVSSSTPVNHSTPTAQDYQAPENTISSPYLAAAAKEAVRREFMNMPACISHPLQAVPSPGERVVPEGDSNPSVRGTASTKGGNSAHVTNMSPMAASAASPSNGDAKVPSPVAEIVQSNGSQIQQEREADKKEGEKDLNEEREGKKDERKGLEGESMGMPLMQHYLVPPGHGPPPGMMMLGPNGHMMMAPAPGMYAPPGMMMFGRQQAFPGGMMMGRPLQGPMATPSQDGSMKVETTEEKKKRIEHEKQELIREFKKKTREAALVRFRQKRRERRFGKLIRYDCRKKLADARPRVKGRFVRIKDGEEEDDESAQVVPDMDAR